MKSGKEDGFGMLKNEEGINANATCVICDTRDREGGIGCCLRGVSDS